MAYESGSERTEAQLREQHQPNSENVSQFARNLTDSHNSGGHEAESMRSLFHTADVGAPPPGNISNVWESHSSVYDVGSINQMSFDSYSGGGGGGGGAWGGGGGGGGDAAIASGGTGGAAGGNLNAEAATTGQVVSQLGGGEQSLGSGFFVSSSGLFATDDHVVNGAQGPIEITTASGQQLEAEPVVEDQANDLAILQVINPATGQPFPPGTFQAAQLGTDAEAAAGVDTTLGHPEGDPNIDIAQFGETGTTPFGDLNVADNEIADNPNRILEDLGELGGGEGIQPGSSGSPVFGANGEVVGIVDLGDGSGSGEATEVSALEADLALAEGMG